MSGPPILLFGAPRSGTSWLGRILDSHPDTLMRHEPDSIDPDPGYPFVPDDLPCPGAEAHLDRLSRCRVLKASGSRPVFAKSFQGAAARLLRRACIYGFKGAERYLHPAFGRLQVPDLADPVRARLVIKSVALGRMGAWAAAWPHARVVLIVRHPCGHAASVLHGQRRGYLARAHPLGFVDCAEARRLGLTQERLEAATPAERAAWRWAVLNARALQQVPDALVVTYEALCADPAAVARQVLDHCGLPWSAQTEAFIAHSTQGNGGFFETRRDPVAAANRWRTSFTDARLVIETVAGTRPAKLFDLSADLAGLAAEQALSARVA